MAEVNRLKLSKALNRLPKRYEWLNSRLGSTPLIKAIESLITIDKRMIIRDEVTPCGTKWIYVNAPFLEIEKVDPNLFSITIHGVSTYNVAI